MFKIQTPAFVSIHLKLSFFNYVTANTESVWPMAVLSSAGLTLATNASLAIGVILAIFILYFSSPFPDRV